MEKLRLRRSARKDSTKIEELVYDDYYQLVPVVDGFRKLNGNPQLFNFRDESV